jgi:CelD/BcsL family acetyltransferase involved in cellulose biosynthesis
LFETQTGFANPFCAPEWVESWYSVFTEEADQVVLTVRSGDQLVGIAPFFVSRASRGGSVFRRLQLVGSGQGGSLLELPQVLATPGAERSVLRMVVSETLRNHDLGRGANWSEVAIPRSSGWFEPEWVARTDQPAAFYRHHGSRACVMLPLAGSWQETRAGLKRNVKESLRRSRNRIAKDGRDWVIHRRGDDLDVSVVDRFLELHRKRAAQQVAVEHGDAFADPRRRELLRVLLPALGRRARATIYEFELAGAVVASQLILHAPGLSYVHSSGFEADVWPLGPVTLLQGEAISDAADRGERWINLSPGPNVAKLRWSEQIETHDDFAYGCGPATLRARYAAFALAQAAKQTRHAFRLNEPAGED